MRFAIENAGRWSIALALLGPVLIPLGWVSCWLLDGQGGTGNVAMWLFLGGFIAAATCEVTACALAIAGRRTSAGKVGLVLGLLLLLLIIGFSCFIVGMMSSGMGGRWGRLTHPLQLVEPIAGGLVLMNNSIFAW
jgi:hypothetical protein